MPFVMGLGRGAGAWQSQGPAVSFFKLVHVLLFFFNIAPKIDLNLSKQTGMHALSMAAP